MDEIYFTYIFKGKNRKYLEGTKLGGLDSVSTVENFISGQNLLYTDRKTKPRGI